MAFTAALTGLKPNFDLLLLRNRARTHGGAAFGDVISFTTMTAAPTVRTLDGRDRGRRTGTLAGTANPPGVGGLAWFRYRARPRNLHGDLRHACAGDESDAGRGARRRRIETTLGTCAGRLLLLRGGQQLRRHHLGAVVRFDVAMPPSPMAASPTAASPSTAAALTVERVAWRSRRRRWRWRYGCGRRRRRHRRHGYGRRRGRPGWRHGGGTGGAGAWWTGGAGGRGGAPADGGAVDGGNDAGQTPPADGGCGCGVAGESSFGGIAGLFLMLCLARRRRRREPPA